MDVLTALTRARYFLGCISVALLTSSVSVCAAQNAAPPRYSASTEYRKMIEELHQPSPSPMFIATGKRAVADASLHPETVDTAQTLTVSTSSVQFTVDKSSSTLTMHNLRSGVSWTFASPACRGQAGTIAREQNSWTIQSPSQCSGASTQITLLTSSLARLDLVAQPNAKPETKHELVFQVEGAGPYFGLGERFYQAGLKGTHLDARPQDRFGEPGHNWVYMGIPFLYTPGGLGFYADTAFDTHFAVDDAGSAVEVKVAAQTVPLYLFAEPNPKAVLTAYTGLTGRTQSLPLWAYGPWVTSLQGKGSVLSDAHRFRTEGVPASALWVFDVLDEKNNLGWPFWFGSYYGDPRSFTDTLHGLGFHVMTYVHPYVRQQILPYSLPSPLYDEAVEKRYLMLDTEGKPAGPRFEEVRTGNVDFTNGDAVDWWQDMIRHAVHDQGFDGWMEDFGEWVRDTDRFKNADGTTMSELYPLFYHKITTLAAQAANPDVVPFSRSGAPGSQAWSPALWGADQASNWSKDMGLPSAVTAGITAGMSGFSNWGPDIMSAGDSRELWMRWVEFGALTPIMRDHVWQKPNGSFNLWTDADTTAHFRRYAILHSTLLPYLVTYGEEAHRTGVPIMRHPGLEYPHDTGSVEAEYEYLLGKELLIAPIVTPSNAREVYVPPGEWINYWNGDPLMGGQKNTINAGTGDIPILVKAGSILPFKPEEEAAHWDWYDSHLLETSLVWKGFLSDTGTAHGEFTLTNGTSATLDQRGETVSILGKSGTIRNYEIILRSHSNPRAVKVDGANLAALTKAADGHRISQWWWNPSSGEVHILFRGSAFRVEVEGMTTALYSNH